MLIYIININKKIKKTKAKNKIILKEMWAILSHIEPKFSASKVKPWGPNFSFQEESQYLNTELL